MVDRPPRQPIGETSRATRHPVPPRRPDTADRARRGRCTAPRRLVGGAGRGPAALVPQRAVDPEGAVPARTMPRHGRGRRTITRCRLR